MKQRNGFIIKIFSLAVVFLILISADYFDASKINNTSSDISDLYVFKSPNNPENLVFIATLGLMNPSVTETAKFDEDVLIEFNIDINGDFIEDLLMQAIPKGGKMYFFGPAEPLSTGLDSTILSNNRLGFVDISDSTKVPFITSTSKGYSLFAGPRDNPFFFDLKRYKEIFDQKNNNINSFRDNGIDKFSGTNVMSVVIELPKKALGTVEDDKINVWLETKRLKK